MFREAFIIQMLIVLSHPNLDFLQGSVAFIQNIRKCRKKDLNTLLKQNISPASKLFVEAPIPTYLCPISQSHAIRIRCLSRFS